MKNLSAMTLGTVQLGLNYGIANNEGKPSREKSFSILNAALQNGINCLDTARGYGDSEEVIGEFLKSYKGEKPAIVTKIPKLQGDSPKALEKFVTEAMEKSLSALGVNKVDAVMLHGSSDPKIYGSACANAMKTLITNGYTNKIGVSIYTSDEIEEMLKYDVFSLAQVPMSIFDQRLIIDGSINKLKERDYTVFVRSVFLQGLFFLNPDTMTDPILVEHVAPRLYLLNEIAKQENMSIAQLAIAFIRDLNGVTSLVLGADTPEQVLTNVACFDTKPLSSEIMNKLQKEFTNIDIPEIMKVLSRPKN